MNSKPLYLDSLIQRMFKISEAIVNISNSIEAIKINGLTITEISKELRLSRKTIRNHLSDLYRLDIINKNVITQNSIVYSINIDPEHLDNENANRILDLLRKNRKNFIGASFKQIYSLLMNLEFNISKENLRPILIQMKMTKVLDNIKVGPITIYKMNQDYSFEELSEKVRKFFNQFRNFRSN